MTPLILILKTTRSSNLAPKELRIDEIVVGGGKADDKNLSKSGILTRIGATEEPTFLTSGAKEAFNQLR